MSEKDEKFIESFIDKRNEDSWKFWMFGDCSQNIFAWRHQNSPSSLTRHLDYCRRLTTILRTSTRIFESYHSDSHSNKGSCHCKPVGPTIGSEVGCYDVFDVDEALFFILDKVKKLLEKGFQLHNMAILLLQDAQFLDCLKAKIMLAFKNSIDITSSQEYAWKCAGIRERIIAKSWKRQQNKGNAPGSSNSKPTLVVDTVAKFKGLE